MGGQQFGTGTLLLDMTHLSRVAGARRGARAGDGGSRHRLAAARQPSSLGGRRPAGQWGIVQKQTGADRLTIGGALSANIHGRGLRLRPIIADVESFDLVDATGRW